MPASLEPQKLTKPVGAGRRLSWSRLLGGFIGLLERPCYWRGDEFEKSPIDEHALAAVQAGRRASANTGSVTPMLKSPGETTF
jgi:hypothetical protein